MPACWGLGRTDYRSALSAYSVGPLSIQLLGGDIQPCRILLQAPWCHFWLYVWFRLGGGFHSRSSWGILIACGMELLPRRGRMRFRARTVFLAWTIHYGGWVCPLWPYPSRHLLLYAYRWSRPCCSWKGMSLIPRFWLARWCQGAESSLLTHPPEVPLLGSLPLLHYFCMSSIHSHSTWMISGEKSIWRASAPPLLPEVASPSLLLPPATSKMLHPFPGPCPFWSGRGQCHPHRWCRQCDF